MGLFRALNAQFRFRLPRSDLVPRRAECQRNTDAESMSKFHDYLNMVETIYEADEEEEEEEEEEPQVRQHFFFFNSPSSPSTLSSLPSASLATPLQTIVHEWTRSTGKSSDVVVRVSGHCFHLHREPLSSRSSYLRRRLAEAADVTVSPLLNITAGTFAEVVSYCYGGAPELTSSNVAAMSIAAVLLEMDDGGGFLRLTEEFFLREVVGNAGNAAEVLRACVGMITLTGGEAAVALAARCAVVLAEEGAGGGVGDDWAADLMALPAAEFRRIAESWADRAIHDHDFLYQIVDRYLEVSRETLSEEEKMEICSKINCSRLSHDVLVHLVKNSGLPLRFVIQATLLDKLEARRSFHLDPLIISTASFEATALRIESLERDVAGLRRHLRWSEEKRAEMGSARSESFRFLRGHRAAPLPAQPKGQRKGRGFHRRLVDGLRRIFRPTAAELVGHKGGSSTGTGGKSKNDARLPRDY